MFPQLEDQLCAFTPQGYEGQGSPDRGEALVWAMTELMLGAPAATYKGIDGNQIVRPWGVRGRYR